MLPWCYFRTVPCRRRRTFPEWTSMQKLWETAGWGVRATSGRRVSGSRSAGASGLTPRSRLRSRRRTAATATVIATDCLHHHCYHDHRCYHRQSIVITIITVSSPSSSITPSSPPAALLSMWLRGARPWRSAFGPARRVPRRSCESWRRRSRKGVLCRFGFGGQDAVFV